MFFELVMEDLSPKTLEHLRGLFEKKRHKRKRSRSVELDGYQISKETFPHVGTGSFFPSSTLGGQIPGGIMRHS